MYSKEELDKMSVKEKLAATEQTADGIFPILFQQLKRPGERWREHIRLGLDNNGIYVTFSPLTALGQRVCDLMAKEMKERGIGRGGFTAEVV